MRTKKFTAEELRKLRDMAAQWGKIVSRHAFGEDGPGLDVDFRTLEQIAMAVAQGVTEGTLQHLTHQQAEKLPLDQPCPDCGRLCSTEPSQRPLVVQGGTIQQTEPKAHCPDCRRDFFPPTDHTRAG